MWLFYLGFGRPISYNHCVLVKMAAGNAKILVNGSGIHYEKAGYGSNVMLLFTGMFGKFVQ